MRRSAFREPPTYNPTNKKMKKFLTTLSALALASTLSLAQDKPAGPPPGGPDGKPGRERPNPEEAFKKLDTNNDGSISLDEFKAGPMGQRDPARAEEAYKKMDKDSDGKVTLEEFKAGRPQRPGGPGGPGGGRPPGGPGGGGPGGGPGAKPAPPQ